MSKLFRTVGGHFTFPRFVRYILEKRNVIRRVGYPALTGKRAQRTADACNRKHLTVLSRGARKDSQWNTST